MDSTQNGYPIEGRCQQLCTYMYIVMCSCKSVSSHKDWVQQAKKSLNGKEITENVMFKRSKKLASMIPNKSYMYQLTTKV